MPRNMSFALTTEQVLNETKTVTRRLGWKNLEQYQEVWACKKCMGLKKGEKVEKIAMLTILNVRREPLNAITQEEVVKEGFPDMTRDQFIKFFCKTHKGCTPDTEVTRIEFTQLPF